MNVNDLLVKDCMIMDLKATTKADAIDEMVQKLFDQGRISDIATFKEGILAREAQTSTGLGDGVAMPHAKNAAVKEATVLFAKSANGLDYEALDGQPTFLFFMIAAPEGANDTHLQALAALSRQLIHPEFIQKLKDATSPDQVQNAFAAAEDADAKKEAKEQEEAKTPVQHEKFVVAVTACPTGIAHTYMAADALKEKAEKMGVGIKVETNGSDGVKNKLTSEDIAKAEAVIIAADKNVEMARFDGKPLLNRPVSDGIRKTEELITKAVNADAPIYHAAKSDSSSADEGSASGSIGSQIYKHLMNGVSHMLPFVIGGGIAIAIAFLLDGLIGVPDELLSSLGSYNQIPALFNTIGGAAFGFMLPVLAGYIGASIADRPGLITGFTAGALAQSGASFTNVLGSSSSIQVDAVTSGFLGALVGGFIAGYVVLLLKKLLAGLPKSLEGIKTILFLPVFGVIITGFLMLLVNIPMSSINTGLNNFLDSMSGTNAALLGALLGGMMAIDMGGPINKAAYVFGTGTIAASVAEKGSVVMASVMAGGMVPPLAIFIATLLFKNKFSKSERESGITNLVMGLSFITEGAIPFAASDPLRMIPSFVVGSAVTGGLVSAFGIRLMAPHGGIFVIGLVSSPLLYLAFIAIGSFISAFILGAIRKPIAE